ncbi:hypothetical protein D3C87_2024580 [compost metagenome]
MDSSRELDTTEPRVPVVGASTPATPEEKVSFQRVPPIGCKPCSLAKLATATWPMALVCWLLKLAVMTPVASIVRLEIWPVA